MLLRKVTSRFVEADQARSEVVRFSIILPAPISINSISRFVRERIVLVNCGRLSAAADGGSQGIQAASCVPMLAVGVVLDPVFTDSRVDCVLGSTTSSCAAVAGGLADPTSQRSAETISKHRSKVSQRM